MKVYKTLKFYRPVVLITAIVIGVWLFAWIKAYFNVTLEAKGSLDILLAMILDGIIMAGLFDFFNARQQRNMEKHLHDHLQEIERILLDTHKPRL